jgi:hypothetical protein
MNQTDAIRILQRPKRKPGYSLQNSNIFKYDFKFHVVSQDAEEMREQSAFGHMNTNNTAEGRLQVK